MHSDDYYESDSSYGSYDSEQDDDELNQLVTQVQNKLPKSSTKLINIAEIRKLLVSNDLKINATVNNLKSKYNSYLSLPPKFDSVQFASSSSSLSFDHISPSVIHTSPKQLKIGGSKLSKLAKLRNKDRESQLNDMDFKSKSLSILDGLSTGTVLPRETKFKFGRKPEVITDGTKKEIEIATENSDSIDTHQDEDDIDIDFQLKSNRHLLQQPISQISNFLINSITMKKNLRKNLLINKLIFANNLDFKTEDKDKPVVKQSIAKEQPNKEIKRKTNNTTNQLSKLSIKTFTIPKPHKSFITMGHIDSGKSTIMGRLLYDIGKISTLQLNKLIKESTKIGKSSFALAWILDENSQERERGITIDINLFNFETPTTDFTLIDSPGHNDYMPQLISGITQADFGILSIDCSTNNFESSFVQGQFPKLVLLCKCLSLNKLVILVNKLDLVEYDEDRFNYIVGEIKTYLKEIDFEPEIYFVPIVGLTGLNIIKKSEIPKFNWYKGETLLQLLERIPISHTKEISITEKENFKLSINDIYYDANHVVIRGKVIDGLVETNDVIEFLPSQKIAKVTSISNIDNNAVKKFSYKGDNCLLKFPKFEYENENIKIGDLLVPQEFKTIQLTNKFKINLELFEMKKPILVGTPFVLFRDNLEIPAKISDIVSINGKKTSKKHLASKTNAEVIIQLPSIIPISLFSDNVVLGRVILRKDADIIGFGKVTEIITPLV